MGKTLYIAPEGLKELLLNAMNPAADVSPRSAFQATSGQEQLAPVTQTLKKDARLG